MASPKVYFPGLYGLRFVSAIAILIVHVELTKKAMGHGEGLWFDPDNTERVASTPFAAIMNGDVRWEAALIMSFGPQALIFFFVLSGFLVTFLLFEEKRVTQTISLKKFFYRRFLRLWPLYYVFVILGFFVLPHFDWFYIPKQLAFVQENYWTIFLCFIFLLPNLAMSIFPSPFPNVGQMWSIGMEEQFYIIWPLMLKYVKHALFAMIAIMVLILGIKVFIYLLPDGQPIVAVAKRFFGMFKVEPIALGGIGAYILFFNKTFWLKFIYHPVIQVLAIVSIPAIALFLPNSLLNVAHLVYSIPALVICMNVGANPKSLLKLNHGWLDYLGKISYGIYMFHFVCITFTLHLLEAILDLPQRLGMWNNLLVYVIAIGLTIGVSALSYEYFEKRFLVRKKKFVTVDSGKI
jgi:peptidoglycan/LPS O-acetylase OafA/YrhL